MYQLLSLGAINKLTGEYVSAKNANKKDKYECPDCGDDLILCQGEIRNSYFRHEADRINPCFYYSKPTESQIHKDAKMLLKNLLERKIQISLIRNCCCCKKNEEFEIPEICELSFIEIEYRFEYNGVKIADVAYIDNGELFCIFEICYTHKTCSENRPEPWFEINAEMLIKIANDNNLTSLQIPCMRCEKCDDCIKEEKRKIILERIYNLKQILEGITGWGASKSEKNEKSKIRKQINKLNGELLLLTKKNEEIVMTKEEKLLNCNCNIEKDLIINNIEYSYEFNNGTRIYQIKIPNTNNYIKYSSSSKKICINKEKKWHDNLDLNSVLYGKIYLNIPFEDKDKFKYSYNGYWDSEKKLWYISKNHKDVEVILSRWREHNINFAL
jgi:uncharacterized protein YkuJ